MPLSVIIPIPKMTGETPEVRSDKRRREEREEEKRQKKEKKEKKKKKEKKDHGNSWNIMDHHGIENEELNAD